MGYLQICRVDGNINFKAVRTCCHACLYHFLYVVVQLLCKVTVAYGQGFFLFQRDGKPICVVHTVENQLPFETDVVLDNLLTDGCHVVCSLDGPAHIDGLIDDDAAAIDVLCV